MESLELRAVQHEHDIVRDVQHDRDDVLPVSANAAVFIVVRGPLLRE